MTSRQMLQSKMLDKSTKSVSGKTLTLFVAVIDVGTTYSGFAFSENQHDQTPIRTHNWVAGSGGLISNKAPTCVLCKPDGTFHAFGYEAEDKYSELSEDGEHKDWFFFNRFTRTMFLHDKKINQDMEIEDDKGKTMRAKDVLSMAIKYLKDQTFQELANRVNGLKMNDIHWVLTVPVMWTDSAKQFMRDAAQEAGIDGNMLSTLLEPEAAFMYCNDMCPFDGKQFVVIDLGGRTANFTVHEHVGDDCLREQFPPSFGPWGSATVDDNFIQLLIKVIGATVFTKFCKESKASELDLYREFEIKKRAFDPCRTNTITLRLPIEMDEMFRDECGYTIREALKASSFREKMMCVRDKIRIHSDLFISFYKECSDNIVNHLKAMKQKPELQSVNTFLMVGGFSESKVIQEAVRKAFPNVNVVIPPEPGLAVMKGAMAICLQSSKPTDDQEESESQLDIEDSGEKVPFSLDFDVKDQDDMIAEDKKRAAMDAFSWGQNSQYQGNSSKVTTGLPRVYSQGKLRSAWTTFRKNFPDKKLQGQSSLNQGYSAKAKTEMRRAHSQGKLQSAWTTFTDEFPCQKLEGQTWLSKGDTATPAVDLSRVDSQDKLQSFTGHLPLDWPSGETGQISQNQVSSSMATRGSQDKLQSLPQYPMDRNPRGWCLIINIMKFYNENNEIEEIRRGSDIDEVRLAKVFGDLKFKVKIQRDPSRTELTRELTHMAQLDHSSYNCFVCCILSHGSEERIKCSDGEYVRIRHITDPFQPDMSHSLKEKPKLFFFQACQGLDKQTGHTSPNKGDEATAGIDLSRVDSQDTLNSFAGNLPLDELSGEPDTAVEADGPEENTHRKFISDEFDFLYGYATVQGYEAYRDGVQGSWYMKALCESLQKFTGEDLVSILTEVNNEVSQKGNGENSQVPEPRHTLRKKIFFH